MKFRTIVIAFFFALLLTPSMKAAGQTYNDAISIDPFSLLWGFSATFETKMSETNSLTLSAMYASWGGGGWFGVTSYNETYFGVGASYRWYIVNWFWDKKKKHGPIEGFGFGPAVALGFYSGYDGTWDINNGTFGKRTSPSVSIGGEASYKWVFAENWFLEPVVKLLITIPTYSRGFGDYGGINIGYTW